MESYKYLFFFIVFVIGCDTSSQSITDYKYEGVGSFDLNVFHLKTPLEFKFKNSEEMLIRLENEIVFYIEPNSFSCKSSEIVHLEVRTFLTMPDMVLANLSTTTKKDLLISEGMFNLYAYTDNGQVELQKDMLVRFPKEKTSDFLSNIYTGDSNSDEIIWELSDKTNNMLVSYPIETICVEVGTECLPFYGIGSKEVKNYQNTLLSTKEVEKRHYSFCTGKVVELVLEYPKLSLYEIDSLMCEYISNVYLKEFPVSDKINDHRSELLKVFEKYKAERLGDFIPIEFDDIEWEDKTKTYNYLSEKGYSKNEITEMTLKYNFRKKILAKNETDEALGYLFPLNKLGWINIDKVKTRDTWEELELNVRIESADFDSTNPSQVNVIFPNEKSLFSLARDKDFSFTNTLDEVSNKLPLGDSVLILAVSYFSEKPYYDFERIKVSEKNEVLLNVKPNISYESMKLQIEELIQ